MKSARFAILEAAKKLFAQKGYSACSIREICDAAGITKPVLYYHFSSKEHLYQELMVDMVTHTRKSLLRLSQFRGSLRELLVSYIVSEFDNCKNDTDGMRLLFRMMFAPEGEYPHFNFIEEFKHERQVLADFIEKGSDGNACPNSELASNALMGTMLMATLEFLFTGCRTLTRHKAESLVDLLLPFSKESGIVIPDGIGDEDSK
jgi:AcrR family transcriptional regulator